MRDTPVGRWDVRADFIEHSPRPEFVPAEFAGQPVARPAGAGYDTGHPRPPHQPRSPAMPLDTRRSFNQKLLGSLMTFGLLETLYAGRLFADAVRPVIDRWVLDLHELGR